jgi:phage terminase small subunit
MLTQNHNANRFKHFAEALAQGKNNIDAAKLAGYTGTNHILSVKANRLCKNKQVIAILKELTKKEDKAAIMTATEWRTEVSALARDKQTNIVARSKFYDMLGKASALYSQKMVVDLNIEPITITGPKGNPILDLDTKGNE